MEQFRLPKIPMPMLELPQAIQDVIQEAEEKLARRPKLLQLFKNCFPNTLETTTKLMDDGTTFVITLRHSRLLASGFRRASDSLRAVCQK